MVVHICNPSTPTVGGRVRRIDEKLMVQLAQSGRATETRETSLKQGGKKELNPQSGPDLHTHACAHTHTRTHIKNMQDSQIYIRIWSYETK